MKAIFNRAPLAPTTRAPLAPGAIRPEGWLKEQLELVRSSFSALGSDPWQGGWQGGALAPVYLENLISLAWVTGDEALKEKASALAEELLGSQGEDGWFGPEGDGDHYARVRALFALRRYFLATGDKRVLMMMDRFFKYQYRTLAQEPLKGKAIACGGDNMELCLWLYDITGQKYLLELCRRLKEQTLDWVNHFHSFPCTTPMNRSMRFQRLQEGIREEEADRETLEGARRPYFHTQFELTGGVSVAAGLKAPGVINQFKSGFKEQQGFRAGWEKLMKYHGTACGMYTCDTHLNGANPAQGLDARAIVRLLDTLEALIALDDTGEDLAAILEKLAYNALPAIFDAESGKPALFQQVNQVAATKGPRKWYNGPEDANLFSPDGELFSELFGAWPRFTEALWYATDDDGLYAASYAPCTVRRNLAGVPVRLTVGGAYPFGEAVHLRVECKSPVEFPLYLRIPAWVRQPMIHLPDGSIMQIRPGEVPCIRRQWHSGDTLTLSLPTAPRLTRWYHQSGAVELGPLVMVRQLEELREERQGGAVAVVTNDAWNWALVRDEPMKAAYNEDHASAFGRDVPGAQVYVRAVQVDWPAEGASTGSLPMAPALRSSPQTICLVPYGGTALRIAQFPIATIPRAAGEAGIK